MKECQTQRHGILGIVACVRGRRDGSLSHDPKSIMQAIGEGYELKDGTFGKPESYLGSELRNLHYQTEHSAGVCSVINT
jgi:hypothetical protein